MTIKFSDETIHGARAVYLASSAKPRDDNGVPNDWRAAAAVFEAAANGQVEGNAPVPFSDEAMRKMWGVPATEPFVMGKRYRTRGGHVAEVTAVCDGYARADYEGLGSIIVDFSGKALPPFNGPYDILPGAIDDELAEGVAMTDEQLADVLCRFAIKVDPDDGWMTDEDRAELEAATKQLCLKVAAVIASGMAHRNMAFADIAAKLECSEREVRGYFNRLASGVGGNFSTIALFLYALDLDIKFELERRVTPPQDANGTAEPSLAQAST